MSTCSKMQIKQVKGAFAKKQVFVSFVIFTSHVKVSRSKRCWFIHIKRDEICCCKWTGIVKLKKGKVHQIVARERDLCTWEGTPGVTQYTTSDMLTLNKRIRVCVFLYPALHPILFWLQGTCCQQLESDHLLLLNYASFIFGSIRPWTSKGCQISSQHSGLCVVFLHQPLQLLMSTYLPLHATIFEFSLPSAR